MRNPLLHRLYARSSLFRKTVMGISARMELSMLGGHKDARVMASLRRSRRSAESLLSGNEAFMVYSVARTQSQLEGEMAEVGVYQGCSAMLISEASQGKSLHLFDTFSGLPEPGTAEYSHLRKNQYRSSLGAVQTFLMQRPNIVFHPGFFPGTAAGLEDHRFSFVHIDVDLKSSTRACLDFFYPRLVQGGIIMTHDYSYLEGVQQAFSEFIAGLPGSKGQLIELSTSQAMLVKA